MFLVLLTYLAPEEEVLPLRPAHYEFVDKLFAEGILLLGGRRVPATGGFMLAGEVGRELLADRLAADPYLVAGLVTHEIVELMPTRARPELAAAIGLEL
ncbi:MAG: YciI family protein [Actinomadura sp.]